MRTDLRVSVQTGPCIDHRVANLLPLTRFEERELELAITRMSTLLVHEVPPQARDVPSQVLEVPPQVREVPSQVRMTFVPPARR
jgi:hypothetical protein